MLIEKKPVIAANDVVSFRLNSGEEVIAKVVSLDDDSITVTKPIIAQMQMVSQNQAALAFAPFMATADDSVARFRFDRKSHMVCEPIKPRQDITSQYIKMTTGIEIATGIVTK